MHTRVLDAVTRSIQALLSNRNNPVLQMSHGLDRVRSNGAYVVRPSTILIPHGIREQVNGHPERTSSRSVFAGSEQWIYVSK